MAQYYGQGITGSAAAPSSTPLANAPAPTATPTGSYNTIHKVTQGWYITCGIVVSVMLANTKAGPFLVGILGVALIYQTSLLIQHK